MSFQWWIAALHFIGQYSIALNEFCVLFVGNCDFVNHHKSLYLYVCWNAHILSHLITALLQLSLIPLSSLSPIKSRMTTFWYRLPTVPRHTWKNVRWHANRQTDNSVHMTTKNVRCDLPRPRPRVGSGVVRIDPLRFVVGCCTGWLNLV